MTQPTLTDRDLQRCSAPARPAPSTPTWRSGSIRRRERPRAQRRSWSSPGSAAARRCGRSRSPRRDRREQPGAGRRPLLVGVGRLRWHAARADRAAASDTPPPHPRRRADADAVPRHRRQHPRRRRRRHPRPRRSSGLASTVSAGSPCRPSTSLARRGPRRDGARDAAVHRRPTRVLGHGGTGRGRRLRLVEGPTIAVATGEPESNLYRRGWVKAGYDRQRRADRSWATLPDCPVPARSTGRRTRSLPCRRYDRHRVLRIRGLRGGGQRSSDVLRGRCRSGRHEWPGLAPGQPALVPVRDEGRAQPSSWASTATSVYGLVPGNGTVVRGSTP